MAWISPLLTFVVIPVLYYDVACMRGARARRSAAV